VAVQAITGGTLWDWTARSGQNLHPFALRESGAHGYSCPDWTSSPDCLTGAQHTDLSFRLIGTVVGGAGPIPPIAPPPGDTTPPVLSAKAPKAESIKRGFVTVTDTTNEPATDTATGSVSLSKAAKAYKLKPATVKHAAGTVALRLKIPKRTRKAIRQAIRNRRKATANIRIVSQDAAGNRATRTLRIKLKR
jgi:hypothetical protein